MKKYLFVLFMPFSGIVFCFATPAQVDFIEKKSNIELTINSYDFVQADHVYVMADFRYEQSYWNCLYLNQCKQIKTGYNSTYGTYSSTPIDNGIRLCNRSSI